ncbi:hypothetical protein [Nocardioides zeae]
MPTPTVSRERRLGAWWVLVVGGLVLLVLGGTDVLPGVTEGIGAVAVTSAYTWALAARTGAGRSSSPRSPPWRARPCSSSTRRSCAPGRP